MSTLLVWNRKKDGGNILLVLGGVLRSVFFGPGGLIPLAVLTCRPPLPPAPYSAYARR